MPLSGKQMIKLLKKNGWHILRQKGSHHVLGKQGHKNVVVPVHGNKSLKKGTEQNILRQAGVKR